MARFVFSLILSLLVGTRAEATLEKSFTEGYLGEKNSSSYAGPWRPGFHHDPYFGRYVSDDEQFYGGYFFPYIWSNASDWGRFFSEEVMGASACPHPVLSKYFDEIRYAHRLLALSYLLEVMDASRADMDLLKQTQLCRFDLQGLIKGCRPKSEDMKIFLQNLQQQAPYSAPVIGKTHNFIKFEREWLESVQKSSGSMASARAGVQCRSEGKMCGTSLPEVAPVMERACAEDKAFFHEVCSEEDQIYGVSTAPLATYLLGTSNMVTLLNDEGLAEGCLRRFGQMMGGKERGRPATSSMMPLVYASLKKNYGNRYPHGRAFIYGSLKEFQQKGLKNIFEAKVEKPVEKPVVVVKPIEKPVVVEKPVEKPVVVAVVELPKVEKAPEVVLEMKSAFLQAAEVRQSQNLDLVDVDMLKFNYDYVFSAAELQLLQSSLKNFTQRKALEQMKDGDKLGSKEAAVPLTFIKFLIDSNDHQGLYNLVGVLSDRFWIKNDVDAKLKPPAEFCELRNDATTSNTWQLYIRRPEDE
jgi:hypothetical protein